MTRVVYGIVTSILVVSLLLLLFFVFQSDTGQKIIPRNPNSFWLLTVILPLRPPLLRKFLLQLKISRHNFVVLFSRVIILFLNKSNLVFTLYNIEGKITEC